MPARRIEQQLIQALETFIHDFEELDPDLRVSCADQMNQHLLHMQGHVARARRSAIREQRAQGFSLSELATRHGLSTSRIHQIETGVVGRKSKQSLT